MSDSSLSKALQRAQEAVGIERAPRGQNGFHRLRHTFATRLGSLGVPHGAIRRLLAHAPGSSMTDQYVQRDDSQDRAAMAALAEAMRAP